ncbi:FKBP-type peptidyl-prolyl cis-trans isomerase [Dethiosulfatarculus sandiegensis]|uniref:FKBP-type peptidyl-prolyl cis-trans isomerase n=1 Tax=Dethiosulfatarculus sandiegensis TaxID=1429043 RepID=UPI0005CA12A7|nr:peptidylprolyl isomerase [Dethiosulfatarculus sandiegensis]
MAEIKAGDKVRIHYTVTLDDGVAVDSSRQREPLEFVAGSDELIPGVSQAVIGMQTGETKTVVVSPEEGYGPHIPEAVQQAERKHFPPDVKVGDTFKAVAGDKEMMVRVTKVGEEDVEIDANHPLAGETLHFDLEIM